MNFTMHINVKIPTSVGILTSISMINTSSEVLKARKIGGLYYFSVYDQLNVHAQFS